ncbi:MAG: PHP domain-containing protein [Nitrospirota bacterium]
MENADIAKIFHEIADLLEIKGENPFRVRSYRNAGLVIEGLPERVKAIESDVVNIIAHPTGRLIAAREPYPLNMKKVMEAAKRNNVIMELNAYPDRLDLNDIHCKLAKDIGVMVAISTDSHNKMQMEHIRFGVYTARKKSLTALLTSDKVGIKVFVSPL